MVDEIEYLSDFSPINPDHLRVYPLAPRQTIDGPPTVVLTAEQVEAGFPTSREFEPREVDIEVEYRSEELAIEQQSFLEYLGRYRDASISQESMAQLIHKHISQAVKTEYVFVEVTTGTKKTRIGAVHP